MKFKAEHTFEERKLESDRVRSKYPDRIPGKLKIVRGLLGMPLCQILYSLFYSLTVICEKLDKSKMEVRFLEVFRDIS